jgi:hypothetical protein
MLSWLLSLSMDSRLRGNDVGLAARQAGISIQPNNAKKQQDSCSSSLYSTLSAAHLFPIMT